MKFAMNWTFQGSDCDSLCWIPLDAQRTDRSDPSVCGLHTKLPETHLVICGAGGEESKIKSAAAKSSVSDAIQFVGNVEPHRIHRYMQASDLFVLPSHSEGMPNAVMEAMACGLPTSLHKCGRTDGCVAQNRRRSTCASHGQQVARCSTSSRYCGSCETPTDGRRSEKTGPGTVWRSAECTKDLGLSGEPDPHQGGLTLTSSPIQCGC